MSSPDPDITVDVDLRNPGQFFACCGLLELASRLWSGSEAWFATSNSPRACFHIATNGGSNRPIEEIVRRICDGGELVALADDHEAQPQADRKPVVIIPFDLRLDWWLDAYRRGDKSELKVWAGQQTPERNLRALRTAWVEINKRAPNQMGSSELFSQRWPLTGRFGFDPAASWEALDIGFSPDEQQIGALTSPATEILAAVGLQRCRPWHADRRSFRYRAWADPVEISVAPAALVGVGRAISTHEFPVVMRNSQYGSFGWARSLEDER